MNMKRISTAWLKLFFIKTHIMHKLFKNPADVVWGKRFSSSTSNPFTHRLRGTLKMGNAVKLGMGTVFNVGDGGELSIGNHVRITGNTYIGVKEKISIGNDVMIAEFCTIRDNDHGTAADRTIASQPAVGSPISIGNDVWIGAGCAILKGSVIPDGCVIGAHSLVLQKSKLVPYGIYAGSPVRLIRMRTPAEND